jgi:hypothetical protein
MMKNLGFLYLQKMLKFLLWYLQLLINLKVLLHGNNRILKMKDIYIKIKLQIILSQERR